MFVYLMVIDDYEDKRLFVILYEKYRCLLYKVANDVLDDPWLAEDAVHEAFIKIANNIDKVEGCDSNRTKRYLITIVKNTAIDIYRKRKKRTEKEIFVDEIEKTEFLHYSTEDVDNRILEILRNLPVKYRDVFLLKYSAEYENYEIAEILEINQSTVRQRIARGKRIIEKELLKVGLEIR